MDAAETTESPEDRSTEARTAADANPGWYHTIELAPGVLTPGKVDLRRTAKELLPRSLAGQRALDVGTFDGFWAFELEVRGAQVVAIDVEALNAAEWPPNNRRALEAQAREWELELGRGFRIAAHALQSSVQRVCCDVYDLTPERVGGTMDLVFSGALLLHLRDPVRALERIRATLAPGGRVILLEPVSVRDTIRSPFRPVAHFQPLETYFNWWHANLSGLKAWLSAAGFAEVRLRGFHRPPATKLMRAWYAALEAR